MITGQKIDRMDYKSEGKASYDSYDAKGDIGESKSEDNLEVYADDSKGCEEPLPTVEIHAIEYTPTEECPVSDPLELTIKFELDRDVIAGYWKVRRHVGIGSTHQWMGLPGGDRR